MSKITRAEEEHRTKNNSKCCSATSSSVSDVTQQAASKSDINHKHNSDNNSNSSKRCSKESKDVLLITNKKETHIQDTHSGSSTGNNNNSFCDKKIEVIISENVGSAKIKEQQEEDARVLTKQQIELNNHLPSHIITNHQKPLIVEQTEECSTTTEDELIKKNFFIAKNLHIQNRITTATKGFAGYINKQQSGVDKQQVVMSTEKEDLEEQNVRENPLAETLLFKKACNNVDLVALNNDKNNNNQCEDNNYDINKAKNQVIVSSSSILNEEQQQDRLFTIRNIKLNKSQLVDANNRAEQHQVDKTITEMNNNSLKSVSVRNSNKGIVDCPKGNATSKQINMNLDSERRYRPQKYCAVCGDKAIACNFNAVTCESCKAFFRRNAFKEQRLKCLFDNRCTIDRVTRRFCSKCRLLKCFHIGMKREWILTDEQKQIKRVKILQNKQSKQAESSTSKHYDNKINNFNTSTTNSSPNNSDDYSSTTNNSMVNNNNSINTTNLMLPIINMTKGSTDEMKQQAEPNMYNYNKDNNNYNHQAISVKLQSRQQAVSFRQQHEAVYENGYTNQRIPKYKDASTSCPDEGELLNGLHHCSMIAECQYCSIRLTRCNTANNSMNQYETHLNNNNNPLTSNQNQQQQQAYNRQQQQNHQQISQQQQPMQIRVGLPPYNAVSGPTQLHSLSTYAEEQQRAALVAAAAASGGTITSSTGPAAGAAYCFMDIEQHQGQQHQNQLAQFNHHHSASAPSGSSHSHSMSNNNHNQPHSRQIDEHTHQLTMPSQQISTMNNISNHQQQLQLHVMTPTQVAHLNSDNRESSNHLFSAGSNHNQQLHNQLNNNHFSQHQMLNTGSQHISPLHANNQYEIHQVDCGGEYRLDSNSAESTRGASNAAAAYAAQQYASQQSRNVNPFVMALEVGPLQNFSNENQQQKTCFHPATSPPQQQQHPQAASSATLARPVQPTNIQQETSPIMTIQQTNQQQQQTISYQISSDLKNYNIHENNTIENKTIDQETSASTLSRLNLRSKSKNQKNFVDASPSQIESIISNTDSCASEELAYVIESSSPKSSINYNNPPSTCSEISAGQNSSITISQQESPMNNNEKLSTSSSLSSPGTHYVVWNDEVYHEPADTELEMRARVEKLDFSDNERVTIYETIEATRFLFENANSQENHKPSNTLNEIVYFCDAALRRLIKTVKQIKGFRMLSMDDQIVLLKTACFKILLLRSTYHFIPDLEGWCDSKTGKIMRLDFLKRAKKSLVYEKHSDLVKKIPEPLRRDRLIMAIMSMALLFDPNIHLKHSNSVCLDNLLYLSILRKYLIQTQPDPLTKYEYLSGVLQLINACNEEYNVFFSKDFQPEQITPLLIEIFDISMETNTIE